jgi:hypothetical protein
MMHRTTDAKFPIGRYAAHVPSYPHVKMCLQTRYCLLQLIVETTISVLNFLVDKNTSIKSGEVKLVLWTLIYICLIATMCLTFYQGR